MEIKPSCLVSMMAFISYYLLSSLLLLFNIILLFLLLYSVPFSFSVHLFSVHIQNEFNIPDKYQLYL